MKICHYCQSDMLEKRMFLFLKIPLAIILLFVPYGIYICWLPFLIPSNYACKKCGKEMQKPKEIDWREYKKIEQTEESKS